RPRMGSDVGIDTALDHEAAVARNPFDRAPIAEVVPPPALEPVTSNASPLRLCAVRGRRGTSSRGRPRTPIGLKVVRNRELRGDARARPERATEAYLTYGDGAREDESRATPEDRD